MKKIIKISLCVSLCLILIGVILIGTSVFLGGFPSFAYNPKTKAVVQLAEQPEWITQSLDSFNNMQIDLVNSDIIVKEGTEFSITYPESEKENYTIDVCNQTLAITEANPEVFSTIYFGSFGIHQYPVEEITITIPKDYPLSDLTITSDYGDSNIADISCDNLSISNNYGDIYMQNIYCSNLQSNLSDGDCIIDLSAFEDFHHQGNYGDLTVEESTISNSEITLSDGDLDMTDCVIDHMNVQLSYGDLTIMNSQLQTCNGNLNSGDCILEVLDKKESYSLDLTCFSGDINLMDSDVSSTYHSKGNTDKEIILQNDFGDIDLYFQ